MNLKTEPQESRESQDTAKRSLLLLIATLGTGLFLGLAVGLGRIRFVRLIEEFEMPPSLLSDVAFHAALPVVLLAVVVATAAMEITAIEGRRKDTWNLAALIFFLLGFAVFLAGVMSTVLATWNALS